MLNKLFTKFDLYLEKEFFLGELIFFIIGSIFFITVGYDAIVVEKIVLGIAIIVPSLILCLGSLKALVYRYLVK